MPRFLEDKLKAEYPNNPGAVYGAMNKIGAMRGNKETAKGAEMEAKHERDMKAKKPRKKRDSTKSAVKAASKRLKRAL